MLILKWVRYGAWTAFAIVAFVSAAILLGWWRVEGPGRAGTVGQNVPAVGGPFTLVNHAGKTVTDTDFRGKPMAVFFGFTNCPEVCPTTVKSH